MDETADVLRAIGTTLSSVTIVPNLNVTVAGLASLPAGNLFAVVTDGDAGLAWGATVVNTGSGATKYFVWNNGTHWTVAGK